MYDALYIGSDWLKFIIVHIIICRPDISQFSYMPKNIVVHFTDFISAFKYMLVISYIQ